MLFSRHGSLRCALLPRKNIAVSPQRDHPTLRLNVCLREAGPWAFFEGSKADRREP
jgi:hypothetical protein